MSGRDDPSARQEALALRSAVAEGSPDAIFVSDAEGRFVLVNEAATRLTGYTRGELLDKGIPDLDRGHTANEVKRRRERILAGEEGIIETSLRRSDGRLVDVELNSRRIVIEGSAYVQSVARDVSDRRILMRALRESEERYRLLFQEMQEGFALHEMIWDEDGEPVDYRFLDVNAAFERQTGLKKSDVVGRRVRDVLPDVERMWLERYGEVARTGRPIQFQSPTRTLGRHYSVSAFRPREGQFAVTFSDVTSQVLAERVVRATADRLAMAQEVAGIGFLDVNLSTGRGFWSPRTFELLGLVPTGDEETLGTFLAALLPDSRAAFMEGIEAARQGLEIPPFTYTVATPAGQARRVAGRTSVTRTSDPGGHRLVVVLRDVTGEEAAQAQREEHARRLRALATRLVAVREEERAALSRELHDGLGQALTSMRMDLVMLRSSLPPGRPDLRALIDGLIEAGDRSLDDVRDMSSRLRPPILDVMGLGPALAWQVEEYHKKGGPRFHVDVAGCPGDLPKRHAVALFRIAQEALTNVLRHAGAREAWVVVRVEDGSLVLEVRDDGGGIAEDVMDGARALGLIGMRERALSLGGALSVENHPAGGTLVRVRVPLDRETAMATGTDGGP